MAKKKLEAPPTVHDLVEQVVRLQTRARSLYGKIDPLMSQITTALQADPKAPRVFEIDGVQYEWQDLFDGGRAKVKVDQYIARYKITERR